MATYKQLHDWVIATTAAYKALSRTIGFAGGVSINQYRILARLQAFERFDQLRTLAKTLDLHPSTVTLTIQELESMNLVQTDWEQQDRRRTIVSSTERSAHLIEEIDRDIVVCVRQLWKLYDADELLMTYYDSLKTAADKRMLCKYDLSLDNVERAFAEAVFVTHSVESRTLKKNKLSLNCFKVLATLADAPNGLSPVIIVDRTFLRPPEISEALKKLEELKYVSRRKSTSDQRYTYAKITPAARKELEEKIAPDLTDALRAIVPEESRDKAYRYYDIAEKIAEAMRKARESVF